VVEAAAAVLLHGAKPALLQELFGPHGQIRSTGRRVFKLDYSEYYSSVRENWNPNAKSAVENELQSASFYDQYVSSPENNVTAINMRWKCNVCIFCSTNGFDTIEWDSERQIFHAISIVLPTTTELLYLTSVFGNGTTQMLYHSSGSEKWKVSFAPEHQCSRR
jgi:hypothetical protein